MESCSSSVEEDGTPGDQSTAKPIRRDCGDLIDYLEGDSRVFSRRENEPTGAPFVQMFAQTPSEPQDLSTSPPFANETDALRNKHRADVQLLAEVIARVLKNIVEKTQQEDDREESTVTNSNGSSRRDSRSGTPHYAAYETAAPPKIDLTAYVKRLADHSLVSPSTLLGAFILMDRATVKFGDLRIGPRNAFKLFLVSLRVASKMLDIRNLSNRNFAKIGGISWQHMNDLEATFLVDMKFDVMISPTQFRKYVDRLVGAQEDSQPRKVLAPVAPQLPGSREAVGGHHTKSPRSPRGVHSASMRSPTTSSPRVNPSEQRKSF